MSKRIANFNPGPACLPEQVLKEAAAELLDYAGSGMSILESSHRGAEYDAIHSECQTLMRELLGLNDDYRVLFFGGGASTQFAMIPMNLLGKGQVADYILTGSWAKKAAKEARFFGEVNIAATTEVDGKFTRIPRRDELKLTDGAAYVHLTSNNTIFGTQWHDFPTDVSAPLVADMSSDLLSHTFDARAFSLIYAGAQKNLGPAGVTVVIIRDELLARSPALPAMFHYPTQAEKQSLYNTPPVFGVYLVHKVLRWLEANGGLAAIEQHNQRKAQLLYDTIDANADFFRAPVERPSRSWMNVVFRLPTEELEKKLIAEAKQAGMVGLKGHRDVGGCRISIYNSCPYAWVEQVTDLMRDFARKNG